MAKDFLIFFFINKVVYSTGFSTTIRKRTTGEGKNLELITRRRSTETGSCSKVRYSICAGGGIVVWKRRTFRPWRALFRKLFCLEQKYTGSIYFRRIRNSSFEMRSKCPTTILPPPSHSRWFRQTRSRRWEPRRETPWISHRSFVVRKSVT